MSGEATSTTQLSTSCMPKGSIIRSGRRTGDQGCNVTALDGSALGKMIVWSASSTSPGTAEPNPPAELIEAVRAAHTAGARVACTGAFILGAAGLLDGRRATTHWGHTRELARRHPAATVDPDVLYVDDGDVLTSAGKAAAMDLCLHLVRLDHGSANANKIARRLVVPPHRDGGQAQFIAPLPAPARMSSRHLGRHFKHLTGTTPLQWLHTQRIRHAQELLETTDATVDTIAAATGMGTATTLRRHFHRSVGVPPDTYRRTFRS
ncbi:helix-turn-helix domain-containing protein [Streptomyces sp. NPDC006335]|uniref:helix-turn-helix domain-containing protein n=1 Tax=Streptomyces sp. NPDC006335 TaxID=3156895 RepID=UPI0033A6A420